MSSLRSRPGVSFPQSQKGDTIGETDIQKSSKTLAGSTPQGETILETHTQEWETSSESSEDLPLSSLRSRTRCFCYETEPSGDEGETEWGGSLSQSVGGQAPSVAPKNVSGAGDSGGGISNPQGGGGGLVLQVEGMGKWRRKRVWMRLGLKVG